jgi:hypothetical protein
LIFPFLSGIFVLRIDLSESWFFSNTESFISETWWFHFRNVKFSWEEMFVRADGFIYECTSFWNKYLSGSWSIRFWVCHFLRVDRFIFWRFNFPENRSFWVDISICVSFLSIEIGWFNIWPGVT